MQIWLDTHQGIHQALTCMVNAPLSTCTLENLLGAMKHGHAKTQAVSVSNMNTCPARVISFDSSDTVKRVPDTGPTRLSQFCLGLRFIGLGRTRPDYHT